MAPRGLTARDSETRTARERRRLVARLRRGGIRDGGLLRAFGRLPRHLFVPTKLRLCAYDDIPLSIGAGQTISSPTIHARSIEAAKVRPGRRVLEVGTGSGFQTALLAALGAEVYSIERIASLHERAARTLARTALEAHLRLGDGNLGWPERAPFDAIIVGAAAARPPAKLLAQLADRGRMVVPVGARRQDLYVYVRRGKDFDRERLGRVRFVPLIEERRRGRGEGAG